MALLLATHAVQAQSGKAGGIDIRNPPYRCHPTAQPFKTGLCKPAPGETNVPGQVRAALYLQCVANGGRDEYTTNCCGHLTVELARAKNLCGYRR